MTREVKFYFVDKIKIKHISGKNEFDLKCKCWDYCYKYNALHFEIL